jgi:phosphoribosylaminoimidazolecarboxamide formyltransferase/IMP cyclohydrolase
MKLALLSVYEKNGIVDLARFLSSNDYTIISTGGTAKHLRANNIAITDLAEYTKNPEILSGRVKTLHPSIYAGILNIRDNDDHRQQMVDLDLSNIDLVAVNLYPFEKVVKLSPNDKATCIENIDIGGVCLLRAAAKNHESVYVLSSPGQYDQFRNNQEEICRKKLAIEAYSATCSYDMAIRDWMAGETNAITRRYLPEKQLKYGCNPNQTKAMILSAGNMGLPFKVLNGQPGYINVLDAINAWYLVREIRESLGMDAAASFKHVSPAGVALGYPLTEYESTLFKIGTVGSNTDRNDISNITAAYLRARNCDPKSSFGDFISVNAKVDITLANVIKNCVSDGIIAPSYDDDALEILRQKKKGAFIVLKMDPRATKSAVEYREYLGLVLSQTANLYTPTKNDLIDIATKNKGVSETVKNDMVMSLITLKYTQSNSVGYAYRGQMIGIGAGQQSRIDCVRLARMKAETWFLRRHPRIQEFKFVDGVKRQERINAIIQFIEDDFTPIEYNMWKQQFAEVPILFTSTERKTYLSYVDNVILASDAFFPFRDSIDKASKIGVKYIVQPGGSIADESVIKACDEYDMIMVKTGMRLFHH